MRIYIAGPMSGIPQLNFPAFDEAADTLRTHGYEVVSPAELDDPDYRARVMQSKTGKETYLLGVWGDCLSRDVKLIADSGITGIVLLPGWAGSRGARLEVSIGLANQVSFGLYDKRKGFPIVWQNPYAINQELMQGVAHYLDATGQRETLEFRS